MKKTAEKAVDIFKIQSKETTQKTIININGKIKSGRDTNIRSDIKPED